MQRCRMLWTFGSEGVSFLKLGTVGKVMSRSCLRFDSVIHTHTRKHARTHTDAYTFTYIHTHTHHKLTHTQSHTHTHTNTHTLTQNAHFHTTQKNTATGKVLHNTISPMCSDIK